MSTRDRGRLGRRGETWARQYVERSLGWRVWKTNWRCRRGELDLIALNGRELVIIEVRTRRSQYLGDPVESVVDRKLQRLNTVVRHLLAHRDTEPYRDWPVRIDVIGLTVFRGRFVRLQHIRRVHC